MDNPVVPWPPLDGAQQGHLQISEQELSLPTRTSGSGGCSERAMGCTPDYTSLLPRAWGRLTRGDERKGLEKSGKWANIFKETQKWTKQTKSKKI